MNEQVANVVPTGLGHIDAILSSEQLLPAARSLLLLRVCQLAQVIRPELAKHYWLQLKPLRGQLRAPHLPAYDDLCRSLDGSGSGSVQRAARVPFLAEILDTVESATSRARLAPDAAKAALDSACQRLRRLWWWSFGKAEVWHALVLAFAAVDRARAIALVGRAPGRVRVRLIVQLDAGKTLSQEEWAALLAADRKRTAEAIQDLLKRDVSLDGLHGDAALAVGEVLLPKVHAAAPTSDAERVAAANREEALERYKKLVQWIGRNDPDVAEALMENLFLATAMTTLHAEKWLDRFTSLSHVVTFWATVPVDRDRTSAFLRSRCPQHLRDLAVTRWVAMFPSTQQEAEAAWARERPFLQDAAAAEAWFLVTLVARGLAREAMAMAQQSSASGDLVARVRRAVLCVLRDESAALISVEDVQDDLVGRFLRGPTMQDRVDLLRERTAGGRNLLPAELWAKTDGFGRSGKAQHVQPGWYTKTQAAGQQFPEFLRLHAYGQYCYDDVDSLLLATLVAWDGEYPEETAGLVERMWSTVKPDDRELRLDLYRDTLFERCQRVLVALPGDYARVFVEWVKGKLVDSPLRQQQGNMVYTLSLKAQTPFLYCLLGAQRLAKVSGSRCDEMIALAMDRYAGTEELVEWAAQLYSSDKGLAALSWPLPEKNRRHREAWQAGVVEASKQEILFALGPGRALATLPEDASPAVATP